MNDPFPPPNPAIAWYRTMLRILPTCAAVSTLLAVDFLDSRFSGIPSSAWFTGWFVFNLAATVGLGLFDHRLSGGRGNEPEVVAVGRFLLLQLIVPPMILLLAGLVFMILAGFR